MTAVGAGNGGRGSPDGCKTSTVQGPDSADLWPDGVDGDLYSRIVRQVRDYPGGVRFRRLIETIHGPDRVYRTVNGQQRPTAEYQRVRRAVHDLADRGVVRAERHRQQAL